MLACGEAVANAIEHAYAGRPPGRRRSSPLAEDRTLNVRVRDEGALAAAERGRPRAALPRPLPDAQAMDRVDVGLDPGGTECG